MITTGVGANARRFKGGLTLRREWRFRTVQAGVDFIEQIKIIATNGTIYTNWIRYLRIYFLVLDWHLISFHSPVGHPPYRVILDASRGYGHVVVELYTTRLGGLSYNDFSVAQYIDASLYAYRQKAAAAAAQQAQAQAQARQ